VDAHLEACTDCQTAWASLRETLQMVDDAAVPEPGPGFEREMWARVQRSLPAREPVRTSRWAFSNPASFPALAAAATLVLAVGLGGYAISTRLKPALQPVAGGVQAGTPVGTSADAERGRERVLLTALNDHFQQSELLLVELMNAPESGGDRAFERQAADELLDSSRLYRASAQQTGNPRLAAMLQDLESVLVEIARSPTRSTEGLHRTSCASTATACCSRCARFPNRFRIVNDFYRLVRTRHETTEYFRCLCDAGPLAAAVSPRPRQCHPFRRRRPAPLGLARATGAGSRCGSPRWLHPRHRGCGPRVARRDRSTGHERHPAEAVGGAAGSRDGATQREMARNGAARHADARVLAAVDELQLLTSELHDRRSGDAGSSSGLSSIRAAATTGRGDVRPVIAQKFTCTDAALYWKAFAQYRLSKSDDAPHIANCAKLRQSRYLADPRLEATRKASGQPDRRRE
jgi:hypothetical protein